LKDSDLFTLLYGSVKSTRNARSIPNLESVESDLSQDGACIQRLFEDYAVENPEGLKRSQYFEVMVAHLKKKQIHLRMGRKSGEKLFIDFAGTLLRAHPSPGVTLTFPLFICSLGASGKCFALPLKN